MYSKKDPNPIVLIVQNSITYSKYAEMSSKSGQLNQVLKLYLDIIHQLNPDTYNHGKSNRLSD